MSFLFFLWWPEVEKAENFLDGYKIFIIYFWDKKELHNIYQRPMANIFRYFKKYIFYLVLWLLMVLLAVMWFSEGLWSTTTIFHHHPSISDIIFLKSSKCLLLLVLFLSDGYFPHTRQGEKDCTQPHWTDSSDLANMQETASCDTSSKNASVVLVDLHGQFCHPA